MKSACLVQACLNGTNDYRKAEKAYKLCECCSNIFVCETIFHAEMFNGFKNVGRKLLFLCLLVGR
jgi:hypothetical protein